MAKNEGFTAAERAAMKARAAELKAEKAAGRGAKKIEAEATACAETIAGMPDGEREIGVMLQEIVDEVAPELNARTWYGMPAWTRDGKVVVFFKHASKFDMRYSEVGFQEDAWLDDGEIWPTVFAVTTASPAVRTQLTDLVQKASN